MVLPLTVWFLEYQSSKMKPMGPPLAAVLLLLLLASASSSSSPLLKPPTTVSRTRGVLLRNTYCSPSMHHNAHGRRLKVTSLFSNSLFDFFEYSYFALI